MSLNKQSGILVPLAAIIIVGISALAVAIARMSSQSAVSTTQEGLAVQAFYAADSGAQFGMNQIFFSANNRTTADTNCAALVGTTVNFSANGLASCSTGISCVISTDPGNTTSFYLITSAANCGSSDTFAERTVTISAFMQ